MTAMITGSFYFTVRMGILYNILPSIHPLLGEDAWIPIPLPSITAAFFSAVPSP